MSAALMELGQTVCPARAPRCADCPIRDDCAWLAAGKPPYAGPAKPVQRFAGTDRQVRGRLLDVLRDTPTPVAKARLDVVWSDAGQRERCLDSLLTDGLVEQTADGLFALPGEH
jgi:A/G-specific adenine glycosylase